MELLASRKGTDGSPVRWFAEYDSTVSALRERHSRLLLADLTVIMQGASPFGHEIEFGDTMKEVMDKSGQSMQAACHILRDNTLFQALEFNRGHMQIGTYFQRCYFLNVASAQIPLHMQFTGCSCVLIAFRCVLCAGVADPEGLVQPVPRCARPSDQS